MIGRKSITVMALTLVPALGSAQHGPGGAAAAVSPPGEATQFDFLVGQWELTVTPKASTLAAKIHGVPKLVGSWKAWRAFDGWGIEDEMRILDASGNPTSYVHAMRFYDAAKKQWNESVLDVFRARFGAATGTWNGTEMTTTSRGTDSEGHALLARSRFFDVKPGSFRFQQDRSLDEGKTWDEATVKIEAKRVAASATR